MKKILLITCVVLAAFATSAQDYGQSVGSLNVAVDGKKAKDYVYKDGDVEITISRLAVNQVDFNIKNLTDKPIDFFWTDSYFIASGRSTAFQNSGNAMELLTGVAGKEINSTSPKTRIAPGTYITIKTSSKETYLFDFNYANKNYKETGNTPENAAIIALGIDGEMKEKRINFQMYTSRIIKELKKAR
ncbi:hypothetical protein M8998_07350 [Sphingobacterium sp. lm-10]|uniref:hypothetical protein n=1 Tax=Sphingobacterium sp. lm-10 TaxID=2944904 RepID=UPI00202248C1|nr:hypothetical protein [Sphingobacterium sp. lm-10]MCL7987750.1 hypothetical protein [Sphingobacterium sp. lm-10]